MSTGAGGLSADPSHGRETLRTDYTKGRSDTRSEYENTAEF